MPVWSSSCPLTANISVVLGPDISLIPLGLNTTFCGPRFPPQNVPDQVPGTWDLLAPILPLLCDSRVTVGKSYDPRNSGFSSLEYAAWEL